MSIKKVILIIIQLEKMKKMINLVFNTVGTRKLEPHISVENNHLILILVKNLGIFLISIC